MAHTYDTKANLIRGRSASGRDLSYTCGAGATLLVLGIVVDGLTARTGGAPTYNGVALTQASTNAQAVSGETTVELWYLLNPPTGAAYTIHIPDDNNVYFTAEASSYKAQSNYTSALRTADLGSGTGTNPTGPTHTGLASGDVIVAAIGSGATTWNPSGRTGVQLYDVDDGSYGDGGQYLIKTDANNTAMAWTFGTSDDWAIVSAVFKEVQQTVTGTLAGTLGNATGAVAGAHGVAGSAAGTLGNVSGNASGWSIVSGALTGLLALVTAAIIGAHGVAGQVAGSLGSIAGEIMAAHGVTGSAEGLIGSVTGDLSGLVRVEGSLSGTLANASGAATGNHGVAGEAAGVLPNLTGDVIGEYSENIYGALDGILPNLTADVTGVHGVAGMAAGTLPTLTGNLVGTLTDSPGKWKFPTLFSGSGFQYGDYDPGQAAAIAIGCLHIYMKTGDERAGTWARRILDDLRVNRQDQDYGGYMSDRHYGWLNALVLQTFGLGVNGAPGQSYRFPAIAEDKAHFDAMISWIMARAGDEKPNVLNSDLIPFTFCEAGDMWSYAPNYLAMAQMGSLEAVVLMLHGALEHGKLQGDWEWFNRLLAFMVRDNLVVLSPAQIRTVTAACDQAGAVNLVRLRYADYDRDSSNYCEARDQAAIDNWGEQALDLDFRYGSTVILEDPEMARLLCTRLLQRLAPPLEAAEVETWLEGVRIELGDTVAVSSDFHGWDREEFTVLGKNLDLGRRRVHLKLSRTMDCADSWAVDAAGSAFDAWAIDLDSSWDGHWDSRAYVY